MYGKQQEVLSDQRNASSFMLILRKLINLALYYRTNLLTVLTALYCTLQVDTSTIPGEEVGLRLAHAAGFLPSSYLNDSDEGGTDTDWRDRDIDELTQVRCDVM